jgi:hypothetical protein
VSPCFSFIWRGIAWRGIRIGYGTWIDLALDRVNTTLSLRES